MGMSLDLTPAALLTLAWRLADIAVDAGTSIMDIYATPCDVTLKSDGSPLTAADLAAEAIIAARLAALLPGVPVISEEAACRTDGLGSRGETFLLVDPLDGTRELVGRTGEFTVNIAIIADHRPRAGIVHAPALGKLWLGAPGAGAGMAEVVPGRRALGDATRQTLRARPCPNANLIAVASRSHLDRETEKFLATLPIGERRPIGSSLKFCLVAEGLADVYPRFGPTMEWDTAAGQAVLEAAGGRVTTPTGEAFSYGKAAAGYRNGGFIAWGG